MFSKRKSKNDIPSPNNQENPEDDENDGGNDGGNDDEYDDKNDDENLAELVRCFSFEKTEDRRKDELSFFRILFHQITLTNT